MGQNSLSNDIVLMEKVNSDFLCGPSVYNKAMEKIAYYSSQEFNTKKHEKCMGWKFLLHTNESAPLREGFLVCLFFIVLYWKKKLVMENYQIPLSNSISTWPKRRENLDEKLRVLYCIILV